MFNWCKTLVGLNYRRRKTGDEKKMFAKKCGSNISVRERERERSKKNRKQQPPKSERKQFPAHRPRSRRGQMVSLKGNTRHCWWLQNDYLPLYNNENGLFFLLIFSCFD